MSVCFFFSLKKQFLSSKRHLRRILTTLCWPVRSAKHSCLLMTIAEFLSSCFFCFPTSSTRWAPSDVLPCVTQALNYYETAVRQSTSLSFHLYNDLIELLLLLDQFKEAEGHLQDFTAMTDRGITRGIHSLSHCCSPNHLLGCIAGSNEVSLLKSQVECLLLLAKVQRESDQEEAAANNLIRAQQVQNRLYCVEFLSSIHSLSLLLASVF